MKNKECDVVKDLLPSYIDKLTSSETNKYIENHLKECDECNNMLKNMQSETGKQEEQTIKRDVKFAKKYKRKLTILKIIVSTVFIVIIASILRNFIIVTDLIKKSEIYATYENYYTRTCMYDSRGVVIVENYAKDGIYLGKDKSMIKYEDVPVYKSTEYWDSFEEKSTQWVEYATGEKLIYYSDNYGNTIALGRPQPSLTVIDDDIWYLLKFCIFSQIQSATCNGVECYRINANFWDSNEDTCIYVAKDTGLLIRNMAGSVDEEYPYNAIWDFYYEFGTVTDEDVKEPIKEGFTVAE